MAQKPFKPNTPAKPAAAPAKTTDAAVKVNIATGRPAVKPVEVKPVQFIFDRSNYIWFIISIAVVAFGFILMSGTTDIYSNTKIVLAPIVVLTGFALGFFAILKKPETNQHT